jgi:hypothetical protein
MGIEFNDYTNPISAILSSPISAALRGVGSPCSPEAFPLIMWTLTPFVTKIFVRLPLLCDTKAPHSNKTRPQTPCPSANGNGGLLDLVRCFKKARLRCAFCRYSCLGYASLNARFRLLPVDHALFTPPWFSHRRYQFLSASF